MTVQSILRQVDPLHAAVMTMGGIASASGIVPPFTQLLMALSGKGELGDTWHLVSTPGYKLIGEWLGGSSPSDPAATANAVALFCSGAVEAAIMYQLVSNPETLKQVLALPGQVMQGIGSIIPG